ncbi:MAG: hypothetical protein L6R37_005881 [Teloschistes peruensis]|nr:MAG: hypothetical protein L6R37_005881 [Teloschistes peruensis]
MDPATLQQRAESILRRILEGCQKSSNDTCTVAIYDTAWVAMVSKTTDGRSTWLFPESFDFVIRNQNADGSWTNNDSSEDGILSTLAALLAMKRHANQPDLTTTQKTYDLDTRMAKAVTYLQKELPLWDVGASVFIAFELLVPAHLSMLQDEGITLDFPQKSVLMNFRAKKLARLDPSTLYGPQKSTLLYSLEGFIGRINFDKVQHHLTLGSQMGSPSSTAAYLMNCSSWDIRAENYLRDAIANGAGHGCGSVTGTYPTCIFEIAWV